MADGHVSWLRPTHVERDRRAPAPEVLSRSTEASDRGDKFIAYRTIPSHTDYLLLSQEEPRIEHYVREPGGVWRLSTLGKEDHLVLASLDVEIAVTALYEGLVS